MPFDDMCDVPYREAIGSLEYTGIGQMSRHHICGFTPSQIMNPGEKHTGRRSKGFLFKLKGTKGHILEIGSPGTRRRDTVDVDWASQAHRHSISGYIS